MQRLMSWSNARLGIHYRSVPVKLDQFSYSPAELPILYFTGHEPFTLSDDERSKLRRYVLDGGYIYGDACCGSDAFTKAFRTEMAKVFPDKPLVKLALDHPVFDAFYKIENVGYKYDGRKKRGQPYLEGIYVGCRTAVFFTPLDVSCGWAGHEHPSGKRYAVEDARRVGANMITYSLANYQLGRYFSTQKVYYQKGDKTRDEFVLGQVVYRGDWDPDPSEVANLLKHLERNSTVDVQFKRDAVTLKEVDPFAYPVLYMTGHRAFSLSKEEAAGLKRYLLGGGILLADACCGRASFDIAFRREMAKVLPKHKLEPIPLDDPIYNTLYKIQTVRYTPLVRAERPNLRVPTLMGIKVNGMWSVVYSGYALGAGWSEAERPYSRGYSSIDALNGAALQPRVLVHRRAEARHEHHRLRLEPLKNDRTFSA